MFILWISDLSPCCNHSPASRWPCCILPASLYHEKDGLNVTIQHATRVVADSFNKLAEGLKVRDLPSVGGAVAPRPVCCGCKGACAGGEASSICHGLQGGLESHQADLQPRAPLQYERGLRSVKCMVRKFHANVIYIYTLVLKDCFARSRSWPGAGLLDVQCYKGPSRRPCNVYHQCSL